MKKRKPKRKGSGRIWLILIPVLLAAAAAGFLIFNRHEVRIELNGEETVDVEYGNSYQDEGAEAYYHETLIPFLHKELELTTENNVNEKVPGHYTVTYRASFRNLSAEAKRKVNIVDPEPPVITLVSDPEGYTPFGHKYEEEGYSASDNYDGDLSDKVQRTAYKDCVKYTVSDTYGNKTTVTREIIYDDRRGPEITFPQGEAEETVFVGGTWYNDYQAVDDVDGDVTACVKVDGSVDTSSAGDYTLTYTVSDEHGNSSEISRLVHVKERPANNGAAGEDSKTIYLTFDDGPYAYTEELLSILAKYNVKATFFTTSAYPAYAYCMALEAQQGHTVAVHTETHNYAYVYASEDNYWADFSRQNEVIAAQTGSYSNMFRFPGGSSNTVSMNYNSGIMSRLSQQAAARGLIYFDWNVSSGDAGGTTDTEQVYQNVIAGIQACSRSGVPSVVLQHDVKSYSVNAVEKIINWGLENGYHFAALQPGSYAPHQNIAN